MTHTIRATALLLVLMVSGVLAWAHHDVSLTYDITKEVTLTGHATRVLWRNPHVLMYLDVLDPSKGNVTNYECEMGTVERLGELGWTQTTVTAGMVVSITGNPEKLGAPKMTAKSALLPSGRRLDAGQEWMPARGQQTATESVNLPVGTRGMPTPPPPVTPPTRP
jgi:hypothetical protein